MITVKKQSARSRVMKRAYHRIAKPFKRWYRYFLRPHVRGVKVVVSRGEQLLLVRPSYGHGEFTYPGGTVDRGESFIDGAVRELREETGIVCARDELTLIGEYRTEYQYRRVHVQVFYVTKAAASVEIDGDEIIEALWVRPDAWPHNSVLSVRKIYDHFVKKYMQQGASWSTIAT